MPSNDDIKDEAQACEASTSKKRFRINIYLAPSLSAKIDKFRRDGLSINVSKICALALEEWIEENGWRAENQIDLTTVFKPTQATE